MRESLTLLRGKVREPPAHDLELLFPYREGFAFVEQLYRSGGFSLIDAALAAPPLSTAQILHPREYLSGHLPATVDAPAVPVGPSDRREPTVGSPESAHHATLTEHDGRAQSRQSNLDGRTADCDLEALGAFDRFKTGQMVPLLSYGGVHRSEAKLARPRLVDALLSHSRARRPPESTHHRATGFQSGPNPGTTNVR